MMCSVNFRFDKFSKMASNLVATSEFTQLVVTVSNSLCFTANESELSDSHFALNEFVYLGVKSDSCKMYL